MLLILGAGGFAREVYFHLREALEKQGLKSQPEIIFYDDVSGKNSLIISGITHRVVSDFESVKPAKFFVGIGDPKVKKALVTKALNAGLLPAETIIHPTAVTLDKDGIKVGKGGIITANCVLTTHITIGNYVILNLCTTVGHDAIIEDFVTINPGVQISGNVHIKEGAMIGVGACIIEKKNIAEWVTVGAQSCVTKDLTEPNTIYLGIPAKAKLNVIKSTP
jgi:sugar O-acyltransferase (sialic acid O-acetyltransferase NeuD family)